MLRPGDKFGILDEKPHFSKEEPFEHLVYEFVSHGEKIKSVSFIVRKMFPTIEELKMFVSISFPGIKVFVTESVFKENDEDSRTIANLLWSPYFYRRIF